MYACTCSTCNLKGTKAHAHTYIIHTNTRIFIHAGTPPTNTTICMSKSRNSARPRATRAQRPSSPNSRRSYTCVNAANGKKTTTKRSLRRCSAGIPRLIDIACLMELLSVLSISRISTGANADMCMYICMFVCMHVYMYYMCMCMYI